MVKYCCLEHQKQHWATHKPDCKKLQEMHLWAKFYDAKKQLEQNPIGNLQLKTEQKQCGICGASNRRLKRTHCCKNWVCDNEDQYQLMSYSRDFCSRSHDRYTLCGACKECWNHGSPDWRTCKKCLDETSLQDSVWRGLNGYNFLPMINIPYCQGFQIK